jgi:hypothetical protein
LRNNSTFLVLVASFCLSAVAYTAAQPHEVPVDYIEFEEMIIQPEVEYYEFGDYEIRVEPIQVVMDEMIIIAQGSDDVDDGDGANLDMMNANWCLIHPDDVICQDEDQGGDDEEGC